MGRRVFLMMGLGLSFIYNRCNTTCNGKRVERCSLLSIAMPHFFYIRSFRAGHGELSLYTKNICIEVSLELKIALLYKSVDQTVT
jgi:hypothetical protein